MAQVAANSAADETIGKLISDAMETVGAELRRNMLWGNDTDPDTASN